MIISKTNEEIKQYLKNGKNLCLSVAVCKDGKTEKAFFAPEKDKRIFEAGSITKTVTCLILIDELRKKKMTPDTKISDILSLTNGNYPTVKQILTHTAGYSALVKADENNNLLYLERDIPFSFSQNPFADVTGDDLLKAVNIFGRYSLSEYKSEYSNFGLSIAGLLIEKLTENNYSSVLSDFITEHNLTGMSVGKPDSENVIHGFHDDCDCGNWLWDKSAMLSCGGIYSDCDGLIAYGRYLLSVKDNYPEIFCNYCDSFEPDNNQGLAFIHKTDSDIWWHNGGTGCFKTFLGVNFEKNIVSVVLSNQKIRNGMTPEKIGFALIERA